MSDTPRTDAGLEYDDTTVDDVKEFARQLERELNAANAIIKQQQLLEEENLRLQERIKLLEEAGDLLTRMVCRQDGYGIYQDEEDAVNSWHKAKEAKP